jgi:hypothetical protein
MVFPRRLRPVCSALVMMTACHADRLTTREALITPAEPYAWSGGSVDLMSSAFTGDDSLPRFTLGMDTLAASRIGAFTVRVQLPDTNGSITLGVTFHDGRSQLAATLTVGGRFAGWHEGAPLSGNPVVVPGTTELLGNGEHGVVRFDVRTSAAVAALPDSAHEPACAYSSGLSAVAGVVIGVRHPNPPAPSGACRAYAWRLAPTLTAVDSAPVTTAWALAHVGSGQWFVGDRHEAWACDSLRCTWLGLLDQPYGFAVSPDATRVFEELAVGAADATGIPVYAPNGTIAYRLPGVTLINGVGFSGAGDTAYVVGREWGTYDSLTALALDPRNGSVFHAARLPGGYPALLAVDREHPWLYMAEVSYYDSVAGWSRSPVLRVLDRRTMRQVTVLHPAPGTPDNGDGVWALPLISVGERRAYLVLTRNWLTAATLPSYVYVFDLLP